MFEADEDELEYRANREANYKRFYRDEKGELKMKNKINRFYVGAEHIARAIENNHNDDWTHPTQEAAINHARKILESDSSKDVVLVVQITHIVRRAATPIKVEKV